MILFTYKIDVGNWLPSQSSFHRCYYMKKVRGNEAMRKIDAISSIKSRLGGDNIVVSRCDYGKHVGWVINRVTHFLGLFGSIGTDGDTNRSHSNKNKLNVAMLSFNVYSISDNKHRLSNGHRNISIYIYI